MTLNRFFCLRITFGVLQAQDFRATITGQVSDKSNSPIPGAKVKAVRAGTNETTTAETDSSGFFTLSYLTPGDFTVEVSAPGFRTLIEKAINLKVDDKREMPLTLEIGDSRTAITVTAEAEVLRTSDASGGTSFDALQVSR